MDAAGEQLRDEVHPQEVQQFMSWYAPAGAVVLDDNAGTCPTGLAAIRTGRIAILCDRDPTLWEPSLERLRIYYKFLKLQGLLPAIGTEEHELKLQDWETEGTAWQMMLCYAEKVCIRLI